MSLCRMDCIRRIPFKGFLFAGFLLIFILGAQCGEINLQNKIEYFDSAVGKGKVFKTDLFEKPSSTVANLVKREGVTINGEKNCNAVTLVTNAETVVTAGFCVTGKLFICPGKGVDDCNDEYIKSIKQIKPNMIALRSSFSARRYLVEFYENKFIFRIQDRKCLIEYPHGCLIPGFGWKDDYTYTFENTE